MLYLKSELTEDNWRIYSDNIAMARWLQGTVQGMLNAEIADLDPGYRRRVLEEGRPALFLDRKPGHADEEISLTWYDSASRSSSTRIRARRPQIRRLHGAHPRPRRSLTRNGVQALASRGRATRRSPVSTWALAFSESWTEAR